MSLANKPNTYLFYGPDTFRSKKKLREWKEAFIAKYGPGTVRDLEFEEGMDFSSLAGETSLFSSITLTVLRNPLGSDDKKVLELLERNKLDKKHLLVWQEGPIPKPTLKKIEKVVSTGNLLVYEFDYLSGEESKKFLISELRKLGAKIERAALNKLLAYLSDAKGFLDSGRAFFSISQLSAYASGRGINQSDVENLVAPTDDQDAFFPLLNAFSHHDKTAFLSKLDVLVKQTENEAELLGVLNALFNQAKNMLSVLILSEQGNDLKSIDEMMHFKPGRSRYVIADARKFGKENLENLLNKLLEIEYNVKQGGTLLTPELAGLVARL